jgi:hypothetical protein
MHYVPYIFLALVALLGVALLTSDPAAGHRWLSYTGQTGGAVDGNKARLLGAALIVLAALPLFKRKR